MVNKLINSVIWRTDCKSALAGGTASMLTGGNFANGAVTAAFVVLFNDMLHKKEESETWLYGVEEGGTKHALVKTEDNIVYEIQRLHKDMSTWDNIKLWLKLGFKFYTGKAMGYRWDLNTEQGRLDFDAFNSGRDITWYAVDVPNPSLSIQYFESHVNKLWEYNLIFNNCKHYVLEGLRTGGATIYSDTFFPFEPPMSEVTY